jgi:hypothetical protein
VGSTISRWSDPAGELGVAGELRVGDRDAAGPRPAEHVPTNATVSSKLSVGQRIQSMPLIIWTSSRTGAGAAGS